MILSTYGIGALDISAWISEEIKDYILSRMVQKSLIEQDVLELLSLLKNPDTAAGGFEASLVQYAAHIGLQCRFQGVVGYDEEGDFFQREMDSSGIEMILNRDTKPTDYLFNLHCGSEKPIRLNFTSPRSSKECQNILKFDSSDDSIIFIGGQTLRDSCLDGLEASRLPADQEKMLYLNENDVLEPDFLKKLKYFDPHLLIIEEGLIHHCALKGINFFETIKDISGTRLVRSGLSQTRILSNNNRLPVDRYQIKPVDQNGSTESFIAAFLLGYSHHKSYKTCVEMGHLYEEEVASIKGLHISLRQQERLNFQLDEYIHHHL